MTKLSYLEICDHDSTLKILVIGKVHESASLGYQVRLEWILDTIGSAPTAGSDLLRGATHQSNIGLILTNLDKWLIKYFSIKMTQEFLTQIFGGGTSFRPSNEPQRLKNTICLNMVNFSSQPPRHCVQCY